MTGVTWGVAVVAFMRAENPWQLSLQEQSDVPVDTWLRSGVAETTKKGEPARDEIRRTRGVKDSSVLIIPMTISDPNYLETED